MCDWVGFCVVFIGFGVCMLLRFIVRESGPSLQNVDAATTVFFFFLFLNQANKPLYF